ncbi:MAG: sulfite exporter TauE/SafE family protein, partial [Burkholderiales bacterium]|nr:sulfite exporter TauE/SafE family protein [Burkholderiales bacterium]
GALVMGAFAATSAAGLVLAPGLWRRLRAAGGGGAPAAASRLATRAAGALLATASAWALGRDLWPPLAAYCGL